MWSTKHLRWRGMRGELYIFTKFSGSANFLYIFWYKSVVGNLRFYNCLRFLSNLTPTLKILLFLQKQVGSIGFNTKPHSKRGHQHFDGNISIQGVCSLDLLRCVFKAFWYLMRLIASQTTEISLDQVCVIKETFFTPIDPNQDCISIPRGSTKLYWAWICSYIFSGLIKLIQFLTYA